MKKLSLAALALCIALCISSCGDDDPAAPPGDPAYLMPLAVGNQWIGWSSTVSPGTGERHEAYDTLSISRTASAEGETWFVASDDEGYLQRNSSNGLHIWQQGTQSPLSRIWLKYPAKTGDVFLPALYPDSSGLYMRVLATDLPVLVSTRAFHCYKYELFQRSSTGVETSYNYYTYYSPGIGRVKSVQYTAASPTSNPTYQWELISYTLK